MCLPLFTMFASQNSEMGLFRQCFKAEVKFLTQKLLALLAPFPWGGGGVMKSATQISPLLNFTSLNHKTYICQILKFVFCSISDLWEAR